MLKEFKIDQDTLTNAENNFINNDSNELHRRRAAMYRLKSLH